MPMWTCDYDACAKAAVRTYGDCIICERHLCSQHLQRSFHECPVWTDDEGYWEAEAKAERRELTRLIDSIDTNELAEYASVLRNGIAAEVPALEYDTDMKGRVMGGMNYHIEIRFSDGVVWLARIRRFNATSPPPLMRDFIIRSEVATLKFLEHTAVPAPKVYGFALASDASNQVGTGYIFTEKFPGQFFSGCEPSDDQTKFVIRQMAEIYTELYKHPFPFMGSLDQPGADHVGPFAREGLIDLDKDELICIGPCTSPAERYPAEVKLVLDLILRKEMYTPQAVDAYLIHRFLLDVWDQISVNLSKTGPFFLKHADEKGDQVLVDENFNITGVIDWEWCYTTSPEFAFNSPLMFVPAGEFYEAEKAIGPHEEYFASCLEDLGSNELASVVRKGRVLHFFTFCCGYDLSDWNGFLGLFQGLRNAAAIDQDLEWDDWRDEALRRYSNDAGLRSVLARDQESDYKIKFKR